MSKFFRFLFVLICLLGAILGGMTAYYGRAQTAQMLSDFSQTWRLDQFADWCVDQLERITDWAGIRLQADSQSAPVPEWLNERVGEAISPDTAIPTVSADPVLPQENGTQVHAVSLPSPAPVSSEPTTVKPVTVTIPAPSTPPAPSRPRRAKPAYYIIIEDEEMLEEYFDCRQSASGILVTIKPEVADNYFFIFHQRYHVTVSGQPAEQISQRTAGDIVVRVD